jgi:hypothetical protein
MFRRKHISCPWIGQRVLRYDSKTISLKLKFLFLSKENIKKMKRQAKNRLKVFAKCIF